MPVTLPGEQAWSDLQCADSGGPSNIFVAPPGYHSTSFPAVPGSGQQAAMTWPSGESEPDALKEP